MKIIDLEYLRLDLPLAKPYTIAYETVSDTTNIILKISCSDGSVGWGCAAPDQEITGESAEDVTRAIQNSVRPLLIGENPFQIAKVIYRLKQLVPNMKSTMAMVDIALFDLMSRKAGLPMYQLLGGFRDRIQTSITIGIMPVADTLEEAEMHWKNNFNIIKLKGGLNLEEDVEKIYKLRQRFGSELVLRFDANQGYSAAQAIRFIDLTKEARIEILEQPTAFGDEDAMKQVSSSVEVPVMADESIRSLKDAFHLTSKDMIDMVNIKLMKVGGILEAQHINSVAKAAGMEVMVGCLDECALGIAAGLHFTLSRPNVEYADLDGHLDLLNDPFKDLFRIENGWMYPTDQVGLGKVDI